MVIVAPGDCSPSRNVVSKIFTTSEAPIAFFPPQAQDRQVVHTYW